jgi:hypothetical protein
MKLIILKINFNGGQLNIKKILGISKNSKFCREKNFEIENVKNLH